MLAPTKGIRKYAMELVGGHSICPRIKRANMESAPTMEIRESAMELVGGHSICPRIMESAPTKEFEMCGGIWEENVKFRQEIGVS